MKKSNLFKSFLIACLAIMLPMQAVAYDFKVGGLCYNKNSDGTSVTVTFENSSSPRYTYLSGNLNIPQSVTYSNKTYAVTMIGENAFYGCTRVTSLTVPNSVKKIYHHAFHDCSGLKTVSFGNSLVKIFGGAFHGCTSLTSISIPNTVDWVGGSVFRECSSLASATIGTGVLGIGERAFEDCVKLKTITIPNSVKELGSSIFSGCTGLTSVNLGNSITSIGDHAFHNCTALASLTIPNSVKYIGDYALSNCTSLTKVVFPESVVFLGQVLFYECSQLKRVTFPSTLIFIGQQLFSATPNLTAIYSYITDPTKVIVNNSAFHSCDLHVPKGTANLYRSCDQWKNLNIIDDLEYIEEMSNNILGIKLDCGDVVLGLINEDTEVPVKIENNVEISSISFTIKLHENLQLVDDIESFISAGERGENFDFTATQNEDGTITVTGTSSTPLEAGEGTVLNLKVKTAWQNTYNIPVTNMTITTVHGNVKQLPNSATRLVMQGARGDMNGDGRVDLSDALYIINLATGLAE